MDNSRKIYFGNSKAFVAPTMDPEILAMLQAFYSRSDKSIEDRLQTLGDTEDKIKEALKRFYVGYGHDSIGDCADITIFLEDVSMLLAKVIQDNPLYNGQETSSRYFDFSKRVCHNPFRNSTLYPEYEEKADKIQRDLIELYTRFKPIIVDAIRKEHPFGEHESTGTTIGQWESATNARAFDILRSLLPCGMTTQLSWKTSLRKAQERLSLLSTHPLEEVRVLSHELHTHLKSLYPNSFRPLHKMTEELSSLYPYYASFHQHHQSSAIFNLDEADLGSSEEIFEFFDTEYVSPSSSIDDSYLKYLNSRERFDPIPPTTGTHQFIFSFLLDYGSFRDVQRHRNGVCKLPIVGQYMTDIHPWYLEQFGVYRDEIESALERILDNTRSISEPYLDKSFSVSARAFDEAQANMQYLYPLGTTVPVILEYSLQEAIYVAELRSSSTVHPTLRPIAHNIAKILSKEFGVRVNVDTDQSKFCLKRGAQTIFEDGVATA